jgi:hypothetical protein
MLEDRSREEHNDQQWKHAKAAAGTAVKGAVVRRM